MNPKFSIIIPVYNVAPFLRECLDSVLAQTFTDWEAICVDDGSTDGGGTVLDEYAAKDKRFRVIHQQNAGVSAARNAAMRVITGEYFGFLDGDDVLVLDALETVATVLAERRDVDVVFFRKMIPFRREIPMDKIGLGEKCDLLACDGTVAHLFWNEMSPGQPTLRYLRRSVFHSVLFPEGVRNMEDALNLIDILLVPAKRLSVDYGIYGYRERSDSAAHVFSVDRGVELIRTVERMILDIGEKLHGCSTDYRRVCMGVRGTVSYYFLNVLRRASIDTVIDCASRIENCEAITGVKMCTGLLRLRKHIVLRVRRKLFFRVIDVVEKRAARARA